MLMSQASSFGIAILVIYLVQKIRRSPFGMAGTFFWIAGVLMAVGSFL